MLADLAQQNNSNIQGKGHESCAWSGVRYKNHRTIYSCVKKNLIHRCWLTMQAMRAGASLNRCRSISRKKNSGEHRFSSLVNLTHAMSAPGSGATSGIHYEHCEYGAYQAVPTMALYAASKAFVKSFSRGLRYESRNTNVSVTCLSPGPMFYKFHSAGWHGGCRKPQEIWNAGRSSRQKGLKAPIKVWEHSGRGKLSDRKIFKHLLPDALLEKINLYLTKLKPWFMQAVILAGARANTH